MGALSGTSPFWAVETTVSGLNGKKKPVRTVDTLCSVPGAAYARAEWLKAHDRRGWYAKVEVTKYPGKQLASVLGLPDKS